MSFECDEGCCECCKLAECKHLNLLGQCDIYDKRPILCRVDSMFELTGGKGIMARDKYYSLQREFCKFLQQRRK